LIDPTGVRLGLAIKLRNGPPKDGLPAATALERHRLSPGFLAPAVHENAVDRVLFLPLSRHATRYPPRTPLDSDGEHLMSGTFHAKYDGLKVDMFPFKLNGLAGTYCSLPTPIIDAALWVRTQTLKAWWPVSTSRFINSLSA
jgi:hypothetical protein